VLDRDFQELRFRVFEALGRSGLDEALQLALEAEVRYPAKGEVPFWLACIHCRQGADEAALAALRGGLARSLWWPEDWLFEDDDLASLRGSVALAEIAARSARLRAATRHVPEPVLLPAATQGADGPRAVVLALHGWGQEAGEFAAEWAGATGRGFAVVAPQSTQALTPGFFVWDDRALARQTVATQYRAASGELETGGAPLIVAGFSQGGGLAVDLALDGALAPIAGLLALSTGIEDLEAAPDPARLRRAAERGLRGRLVTGAEDEALDGSRALAAAAGAAGVQWPLTELAGGDHRMPPPQSGLLLSELAALVD
jgi:predicted esterase